MYEKGGMTAERFLKFLQKHIFSNYKGYLIVLDNAKSHNNELIKMRLPKVVINRLFILYFGLLYFWIIVFFDYCIIGFF